MSSDAADSGPRSRRGHGFCHYCDPTVNPPPKCYEERGHARSHAVRTRSSFFEPFKNNTLAFRSTCDFFFLANWFLKLPRTEKKKSTSIYLLYRYFTYTFTASCVRSIEKAHIESMNQTTLAMCSIIQIYVRMMRHLCLNV